jgi:hypothetical protein
LRWFVILRPSVHNIPSVTQEGTEERKALDFLIQSGSEDAARVYATLDPASPHRLNPAKLEELIHR